jgi:hypothetical protein
MRRARPPFLFICVIVAQAIDDVTGIPVAHPISLLATFLKLAISVRRLCDLDQLLYQKSHPSLKLR